MASLGHRVSWQASLSLARSDTKILTVDCRTTTHLHSSSRALTHRLSSSAITIHHPAIRHTHPPTTPPTRHPGKLSLLSLILRAMSWQANSNAWPQKHDPAYLTGKRFCTLNETPSQALKVHLVAQLSIAPCFHTTCILRCNMGAC